MLVATLAHPLRPAGHERRMVRNPGTRLSGYQIRFVTTLEETAVYTQVRTVVWEDGAARPLLPDFVVCPGGTPTRADDTKRSSAPRGFRRQRRSRQGSPPALACRVDTHVDARRRDSAGGHP